MSTGKAEELAILGILDAPLAWVVEALTARRDLTSAWYPVANCESKVPEVSGWRLAAFSTRETARAARDRLKRLHPGTRFRVKRYVPEGS